MVYKIKRFSYLRPIEAKLGRLGYSNREISSIIPDLEYIDPELYKNYLETGKIEDKIIHGNSILNYMNKTGLSYLAALIELSKREERHFSTGYKVKKILSGGRKFMKNAKNTLMLNPGKTIGNIGHEAVEGVINAPGSGAISAVAPLPTVAVQKELDKIGISGGEKTIYGMIKLPGTKSKLRGQKMSVSEYTEPGRKKLIGLSKKITGGIGSALDAYYQNPTGYLAL